MFSPAYQQQRHVDVNVLKHNELFLHFDRDQPWTVQFSFHPVSHTAVLPFKGSGQSPDGQTRRGRAVRERKAVESSRSHLEPLKLLREPLHTLIDSSYSSCWNSEALNSGFLMEKQDLKQRFKRKADLVEACFHLCHCCEYDPASCWK